MKKVFFLLCFFILSWEIFTDEPNWNKNNIYPGLSFGIIPGIKLGANYIAKINISPYLLIPFVNNKVGIIFCQPELSVIDLGFNAGLLYGEINPYLAGPDTDRVNNVIKSPLEFLYVGGLVFCVKFTNYAQNGLTANNCLFGLKAILPLIMVLNIEFAYYFNGTTDSERFNVGFGVGF